MNLPFQIEVDGEPREVEARFGTDHDARSLTRWRFPRNAPENEAILDALEFARLASKRWRYYRRAGATVGSLMELHEAVRRSPKAELAMILVVRSTWATLTSVLGFAYFRRSWCHHLVVDFLSAHPQVIGGEPERIRGVGSGLVNQLVAIAEEMEIPCIWGEATAHSAPFYQRVLNVERILDHFFIEDEVMIYCRDRLRRSGAQRLAP